MWIRPKKLRTTTLLVTILLGCGNLHNLRRRNCTTSTNTYYYPNVKYKIMNNNQISIPANPNHWTIPRMKSRIPWMKKLIRDYS
jgi:hypothetical protein